MKTAIAAAALAAAGLCAASAAQAEPWVDWSPSKGVWEITEIHVQPNKLDDYLKGLKRTWVSGAEIAKKQGLIDDYTVMVRVGTNTEGANVITARHWVSLAAMDPDKAKDAEADKLHEQAISKSDNDAMVTGYNQYRKFVSQDIWRPVQFGK